MATDWPDWTDGLRVLPCRIPVAAVSGSFSTTWNSLSDVIYQAGTATLGLQLDGETMTPVQSGSRAGIGATGQDRIQMVHDLSGQRRLTFNVNLPEERWFETYMTVGDHPLLSPPVSITVLYQDVSVTPFRELGRYEVGEGRWTFDKVETSDGGAVSGSFEGTLYTAPEP